ncbi:GntR family transcriptional regulator, partial [Kineococcus glutinatus]|uniref:GntR family transcriptional regulator n=1 Tax=Kineococcus glutinatus TaxID=1070872 RepID=UPI0031E56DAF
MNAPRTDGPRTRVDADTIYARVRAQVLSGARPAGSRVLEVSLAEEFGVSRTPVREALRRLAHDRLLEPGARGLQVRVVTPGEVVQVYDARVLLEAEAAAQAARLARIGDVLELERLLARDRALVEPDDATRTRTNMEFHAALWRAAHNPVLLDLLQRLTVHQVHSPHSTLSVPGRWEEALAEHAALLRAVAEHDEERARRTAADHMRAARDIRLRLLRDAVAPPPGAEGA